MEILNRIIAGDYKGHLLGFKDEKLCILLEEKALIMGTNFKKVMQISKDTVKSYKLVAQCPYKIIQLDYKNGGKA